MTKLVRLALAASALKILMRRKARVVAAVDQKAEAAILWKNLHTRVRAELLAKLEAMATGLNRCMYCEDSMGTDIDHFAPKSKYPTMAFDWDNHFLACSHCNSNAKRDTFPEDDHNQPLLIDPIKDDPRDHIRFSPSTGRYVALDEKGSSSIAVFGLNRGVCVEGRRNAWVVTSALVLAFDRSVRSKHLERSGEIRSALAASPFKSVFNEMTVLSLAESPLVPEEVASIIRLRSELRA